MDAEPGVCWSGSGQVAELHGAFLRSLPSTCIRSGRLKQGVTLSHCAGEDGSERVYCKA